MAGMEKNNLAVMGKFYQLGGCISVFTSYSTCKLREVRFVSLFYSEGFIVLLFKNRRES